MNSPTQEIDSITAGGQTARRSPLKPMAFVAICLLGVVLLFLLAEGLGSVLFVVHDYVSYWTHVIDMEHSTQYDPELGWVNVPNFYSKDFYNPGVYVRTDSQGFRNGEEFARAVPAGRLRVVCTGASMTFAVGVDNDHTWCQILSTQDHRLQTINMGVPGYGLDQVYLLQLREGSKLDYDIQLLAITTDYFRRMTKGNLLGYDKPMLELRNGELVVTRVPVPKSSVFTRWTYWISKLRSVGVLQKFRARFQTARSFDAKTIAAINHNTEQVSDKVLDNLQAEDRRKNAMTVIVFLPSMEELTGASPSTAWRDFVREESAKRGIPFLDLLDDAKKLPISELDKLFLSGEQHYSDAVGHFSDYGNEYVSRRIHEALTADPTVTARLAGLQ